METETTQFYVSGCHGGEDPLVLVPFRAISAVNAAITPISVGQIWISKNHIASSLVILSQRDDGKWRCEVTISGRVRKGKFSERGLRLS